MPLTRRKRQSLFRALAGMLWLAVVFLVLFNPLTGRYLLRLPKGPRYEEHTYTILGNVPLLTIEYDHLTATNYSDSDISRIQPRFGVLYAVIIIGLSGAGCVMLARWGAQHQLIGRCDECGYSLQGIESDQCPECGVVIP